MTTFGTVLLDKAPAHMRATMLPDGERVALSPQTMDGLLDACARAEEDEHCRALVIASDGAEFCSGLPLNNDATVPSDWHPGEVLPPWRLFTRLAQLPVVTVAVVDGPAIGGGFGLAASCDVVLAGTAARFRLTELLFGLIPGMALPFLARRIGEQRAYGLALSTDDLGPHEAERLGVADRRADRAADLVAPLLAGLRRLDRSAIGALKAYRWLAHPIPRHLDIASGQAFFDRIAAPATRARIRALHDAGLLRWGPS
jgi:polyketide biosynthesis enoyl-CoA hydratase PksH